MGPARAGSVRCLGELCTQGCDQPAGGGARLAPEPAGQAGRRRILVGNYLDRARRITCECTDLKTTIRSGGPLSIQARVEASDSAIPGPRALVVETPEGPSNRILFRVTGGPASSRKNRTKAVSKHSRSRRQRSSRARSRPYKTRTCFGSTWTLASDWPSISFQRAAGPAAMWPQS